MGLGSSVFVRQNLIRLGSGLYFEPLQNEDAFWLGLQAGPISNSVVHQLRKYNGPLMQSMTEMCESKLFL